MQILSSIAADDPRRVVLARRAARIAGAVGVGCIGLASLIPGNMQIRTGAPKELEHAVAYAAVAFVLCVGYGSRRIRAAIVIGMITAAALFEILQAMVPGRTRTLADFDASAAGTLFGAILALFALRHLTRQGSETAGSDKMPRSVEASGAR